MSNPEFSETWKMNKYLVKTLCYSFSMNIRILINREKHQVQKSSSSTFIKKCIKQWYKQAKTTKEWEHKNHIFPNSNEIFLYLNVWKAVRWGWKYQNEVENVKMNGCFSCKRLHNSLNSFNEHFSYFFKICEGYLFRRVFILIQITIQRMLQWPTSFSWWTKNCWRENL